MKNTPLLSIIDDSIDRMFVIDKRGKMIFFPWGGQKQGFILKSKSVVAKVKKFYKYSLFICFAIFLITASLFQNNFWGIIGSMFVSFGGWYLAYYLYASKFVKFLPVAKVSYKEIILEKLEPEDNEESSKADIQFPAHWNRPVPQREWNLFAQIQRIWYRLSPGQVLMICFFVSIFTGLIWSTYRPEQWVDADHLVGFLVCLILGYGFLVVAQSMESLKENWFIFFQWKLSAILLVVAAWGFAAWFLYKFVVVIFS